MNKERADKKRKNPKATLPPELAKFEKAVGAETRRLTLAAVNDDPNGYFRAVVNYTFGLKGPISLNREPDTAAKAVVRMLL